MVHLVTLRISSQNRISRISRCGSVTMIASDGRCSVTPVATKTTRRGPLRQYRLAWAVRGADRGTLLRPRRDASDLTRSVSCFSNLTKPLETLKCYTPHSEPLHPVRALQSVMRIAKELPGEHPLTVHSLLRRLRRCCRGPRACTAMRDAH